jgi:hypothetical protein
MQRQDVAARERPVDHRRRTRRAERHATSEAIHCFDVEDLDTVVPARSVHDVTRSDKRAASKPGRRAGFKVWKTPFWKRRTAIRREKALAERRLDED